MAEIQARATNEFNLAAYKANRKDDNTLLEKGYKYDKEGNLVALPWAEGSAAAGGGFFGDLASMLNEPVFSLSDANTITGAVDEDGNFTANSDIVGTTQKAYAEHLQSTAVDYVGAILGTDNQSGMLQLMYPKGNTNAEDQTYSINIKGRGEVNGSISDLRRILSTPANSDGTGGLKYIDAIKELYNTNKAAFIDTRQVTKDNIPTTQDQSTQYDALYNRMVGVNGIDTKAKAGDIIIQEAYRTYKEAYDNNDVLNTVTSGSTVAKNIKGMLDAGMPGLFDENGAPYGTREEHFQEALRRVQNNELTNTDQSWVVDGSTDERYMIDEVTYTPYTTRDGEGGTVTKYRETKTGNKVVDEAELRREAGKVFDALALELNAALTDQRDANTASASFESIKNGVQGGYADIVNNPTYTYEFNPLSPSPNAFGEMQNMLGQLKYLKENGIPFGIGTGTLKNEDQLLQRDGLGTKVLDLLIKDTQTWLNNPKRSNTAAIAPIFRLSYKSVFDIASKADKTHAGFEIDNMSEWLASKVKGPTSDVTKQFGALTTDDIALLKGAGEDDQGTGIFLVFDQKYDLNPKARKNDYFSSTEMDILGGDNSTYHDYVVPNDDGITNTGTFRITKNGTGDYDMIYEINRYNPKPTDPAEQANWTEYTTSTGSEKMDFSQGLMGIDQQTMKMQELLENIRTNNRALQKKDKAIHGK